MKHIQRLLILFLLLSFVIVSSCETFDNSQNEYIQRAKISKEELNKAEAEYVDKKR